MELQKLMRVQYRTDVTDEDPDYIGSFSDAFPAERPGHRIVAVDWSRKGYVEVTWLISAR